MTYPVAGESFKSNSNFGMRDNIKHKGIDLKADSGDRIVAALPGTVVKSDDTSDPNGYGGQILIKHDIDGKVYYTRYAHLRKRYVVTNEQVSQGEKIGEAGGGPNDPNKGRATGPHLHFELLDYGQKPIDPEQFLKGAALGIAVNSSDSEEKNKEKNSETTKSDDPVADAVNKIKKQFSHLYSPVAYLTGLPGLSGVQKETKLSKPILEDIEKIKKLLK